MATEHIRGTARFTYTPSGGSPITHLLAVPLSPVRDLLPSVLKARWDWWSEDLRNREVVTIGDGVAEIVATIRLDDQPVELLAMVRRGLEDDLTLTYQLDESGTEYPLRVIAVVGATGDGIQLTPDRARYGYGEWEITLRLRRTDGGTLTGVFT